MAVDRSYVDVNRVALDRLRAFVEKASDDDLEHPMNDGWTVATVLAHHDDEHHLLPPHVVGHPLRERERRRDHRPDQQDPPEDRDGRDHPRRPADAQGRGRPHRGRDQAAEDRDHVAKAPSISAPSCSPGAGHVITARGYAAPRRRAWCRATRVRFPQAFEHHTRSERVGSK